MESDTPQGEPGELNIDGAAKAFSDFLDPPKEEVKDEKVDTEIDPKPAEAEPEPVAEPNSQEEGADAPITVEVDGKQVTLTKAEIAEHYKNGLRQQDYTRKTMETAEQRKTAEVEIQKAQQERAAYAQNLSKMAAQLEGALEAQSKIDWNDLLERDPVEFLKQKHLFDQRQAAFQQNQQEQSRLAEQNQAEQAKNLRTHLQTQQQELLAKLPEWKDEAKAKSEREALKSHLIERGYTAQEVDGINDHKAVLLARDAMLYRQMMAKAQAAAKQVKNLPTKVERPGVSGETNALDGRTAAMKRLTKSGSIDDAARVFATLL